MELFYIASQDFNFLQTGHGIVYCINRRTLFSPLAKKLSRHKIFSKLDHISSIRNEISQNQISVRRLIQNNFICSS